MYGQISRAVKRARTRGRTVLICGDWNAVVGQRQEAEDARSIGDYGIGARNARGDWFVKWASLERMCIVNTQFDKNLSQQWTYLKGYARRQIDYMAIDQNAAAWTKDAEASDKITVGLDHRGTKVVLELPSRMKKHRQLRRAGAATNMVNWQAEDETTFLTCIESGLDSFVDSPATDTQLLKTLADKCAEVEKLVAEVGVKCRKHQQAGRHHQEKLSQKAKTLIAERRDARARGAGDHARTVKQISKDLQRELRAWDRLQKRRSIEKILDEFKGLKKVASIKNNGKTQRLTSVRDESGDIKYGRQEIVDAFASFYEELYARREVVHQQTPTKAGLKRCAIPKVTAGEVRKQLLLMKNGKASDAAGIVAEMIKAGGERLQSVLADLFNDVLVNNAPPPQEWKHTRIKVLFKKGDPQLPSNYRPISILPIFYKLFSRVLHQRLKAFLEPEQSIDQAGFRSGYNCEDHLLSLVLLYERLTEQNLDLWMAAVDFEKAFDSVSHESIWEALASQSVPEAYISVMQRLYENQTGQIVSDRSSRTFGLERGTKQGDPVSPALFNAVLENIMRKLKDKWKPLKFGINVGANLLNNLRFADDLLLIGGSRAQVKHMLEDLALEAGRVGLKLHMGKTKILSTRSDRRGCLAQQYVGILGERVEVLPASEGTLYLGRMVNFAHFHDAEISHRISRGWAAFGKFKQELCCKHYPLKSRLKLFNATVTATVLYGSGAWTMTKAREQLLQTNMRRILRKLYGCPRKAESDTQIGESWVEWIVRATHFWRTRCGT